MEQKINQNDTQNNYQKDLLINRFSPLKEIIELGKKCDKSGHCCSFGGGFILEHELDDLSRNLKMSKDELIKNYLDEKISFNTKHYKFKSKKTSKPFGPCIFLDNNLCKIHQFKPLHCKVGNCCKKYGEKLSLWFALNHFVNPNDPDSIRQWAIYLKTHPTIPGGELKDLVNDEEKLNKILNHDVL